MLLYLRKWNIAIFNISCRLRESNLFWETIYNIAEWLILSSYNDLGFINNFWRIIITIIRETCRRTFLRRGVSEEIPISRFRFFNCLRLLIVFRSTRLCEEVTLYKLKITTLSSQIDLFGNRSFNLSSLKFSIRICSSHIRWFTGLNIN